MSSDSLLDFEIPGYDILEAIGRGGMASVYRARQHTFDRNVAVKILKPDLSEDDSFCQRFLMESLIVAKLNHSHIVQVYDVGEIANHFYIAMEFLSGGDLNARIREGIEVKEAVRIIKEIASALDFAHKKHIIHRDLKPDNIMFREDEAAVLTDFGIAKETSADVNLTQTGLIVGTPKYMSPEQIRGAAPSPQADIYSLGIVFYQLLCQKVPFHGHDLVSTAYQHFNAPVPQLPAHLSRYQELLEHMLAKHVEDRITCGKDIVKALERLEKNTPADETIVTSKPSGASGSDIEDDATIVKSSQETLPSSRHNTTEIKNKKGTGERSSSQQNRHTSRFKAGALIGAFVLVTASLMGYLWTTDKGDIQTRPLTELSPETEEKITQLLLDALNDIENKRLSQGESNALNKYETVLILSPGHPQAIAGKEKVSKKYLSLAHAAIDNSNFDNAATYIRRAKEITPKLDMSDINSKLERAKSQVTNPVSRFTEMTIGGLLKSAELFEEEGQFFSPPGENAQEAYQKILEIDPHNAQAKRGLEGLSQKK